MRAIDADALLKRVRSEEIQAQAHGREFLTCFASPGGTPSTEWWFVEDLIENAPTIKPERKTGKWIIYEVANCDGEPPIAWECPECGEVVNCKYKFCPECGKPMEV